MTGRRFAKKLRISDSHRARENRPAGVNSVNKASLPERVLIGRGVHTIGRKSEYGTVQDTFQSGEPKKLLCLHRVASRVHNGVAR